MNSAIKVALIFLSSFGAVPQAFSGMSGISYQGKILKPDGTPLEGAIVQFKIQIRTPTAGSCLMYEELKTIDMRHSHGLFALTINDGQGARTDGTGFGIDRVFSNSGTFSFNPATCNTGTIYSPNEDDGRILAVQFKDETMSAYEPIGNQTINFVPLAIEAKKVQGFDAKSILRVQDSDGTLGNFSPLSNLQYAELLKLVAGTSVLYSKQNQLNGKSLPSLAAGEVLSWDGSSWKGLVPTVGAATSTKLLDPDSSSTNAVTFKVDASIAAPYTVTWPATAGSNGQTLASDGAGTLSWITPLSSQTGFSQGGNSFGVDAALGTNDLKALDLKTAGTTRMTIDSSGRVGIGTASPVTNLQVLGATGYGAVMLGDNTTSGNHLLSHEQDGSFHISTGLYGAGNDLFSLGADGVGRFQKGLELAGTDSSYLQVVGNSNSSAIRRAGLIVYNFDGSGYGGHPEISLRHSRGSIGANLPSQAGDTLAEINFQGNRGGTWVLPAQIKSVATQNQSFNANGGALVLSTTANNSGVLSERMRVDQSGFVGIGTSLPNASLHVSDGNPIASTIIPGGPKFISSSSGATGNDFYLVNAGSSAGVFAATRARGTTGVPLPVQNTDVLGLFIFNGFDGSATQYTTAGVKAVVGGTVSSGHVPTDLVLSASDGNNAVNGYQGIERVRITSTGNVGIGTASPQATIDINGYARLKVHNAQPVACSSSNDGAFAMTSQYTTCACKGGSAAWVRTSDGASACIW